MSPSWKQLCWQCTCLQRCWKKISILWTKRVSNNITGTYMMRSGWWLSGDFQFVKLEQCLFLIILGTGVTLITKILLIHAGWMKLGMGIDGNMQIMHDLFFSPCIQGQGHNLRSKVKLLLKMLCPEHTRVTSWWIMGFQNKLAQMFTIMRQE